MDSKYSFGKSSIGTAISKFLMKRKNTNTVDTANGQNSKKLKLQSPGKNGQSPAKNHSPGQANVNGKTKKHQQQRQNQLSLTEQRMQLPVYSVKTA